MPTRPQTFGAFVLGDTLGKTSLGDILKALPLEGPPEMRLLHRVADELGRTAESKALILRQAKQWAAVKDLHVLNLLEAGEADGALYYTFEYSQGRLLSDILERSHHEGLPLSADQAVYIAQRVAQALASISAQSLICGCLSPERVLVTFEGEVKLLPSPLKDLQTTPILASPSLELYRRYLPSAQASGKVAKSASDRYAIGAMLFEFLRQEPFSPASGPLDPAARLEEARRVAAGAEPIPDTLYAILKKCLVQDGADAYPDLPALKADLDQLITSGEYSPTTFNIAFLMHTLFRGEDELQSASDRAFAAMDRSGLQPVKPETPPPAPPPPPRPAAAPAPVPAAVPKAAPAAEEPASFGLEPEPSRKGLFIGLGVAVGVVVFAVLIWLAFFRSKGSSQPDAQTQQQLAELNRLKAAQEDLARKLQSSEEEKKRLQDQMSTAKTAEEKQKAQKALEENQKRLLAQQEEQKRLAAKAPAPAPVETPPAAPPQQASASQPAPAAAQPAPQPPVQTAPPATGTQPAPTPAPESAKKVNAGDLVELWNVDLKPKQLNEMSIEPTPGARLNHPTGTIFVEVLIDETGKVASATVVKGLKSDYGMNAACQEAALRLKYSPALKDGVPVKTKMTFPVLLK